MARSGPVLVVGYDGSATAQAAARYAAARAGGDGTLFVVHAYGPPPDWMGRPGYDLMLHEHQRRGREILDALDLGAGVPVETELIGDQPVDAILSVADARHADEIVVGSRGFGRVRAILGSVSHDLLHRASVPVVVIPAAPEADEG